MKRLRGAPSSPSASLDIVDRPGVRVDQALKANNLHTSNDDIDVGFMLGTVTVPQFAGLLRFLPALLPPQALMPMISSILKQNPSLKPTILSLMPRPSLDSALQALSASAAKLKNAHPYAHPPTVSSLGFDSSNSQFPFERRSDNGISMYAPGHHHSGMRDSYVQSRIAPYLAEFTTNVQSVLPFFSLLPLSSPSPSSSAELKVHPSETFTYLAAVTREIIALPHISQAALRATLIPRIMSEWKGWLHRVDQYINQEAGMFGLTTLKTWEQGLDDFANLSSDSSLGLEYLRQIRDDWVERLGCLVGRMPMRLSMDRET
jgi:hypothetical protein